METLKSMPAINSLPSTYLEINHAKHKFKQEVMAGDYDVRDVAVQLKAAKEYIEQLLEDDDIKGLVIEALERDGGKIEWRGNILAVREGGTKYDYASTQDSEWAMLDAEAAEIATKKKSREKFLQSLPPEGTVSPTTGEQIFRPVKTSKTTFAVTLK